MSEREIVDLDQRLDGWDVSLDAPLKNDSDSSEGLKPLNGLFLRRLGQQIATIQSGTLRKPGKRLERAPTAKQ